MICKKEAEVEVLEKGEEPLGSWRPARILSGNGHTYLVKFDSCPLETAVLMNKVPRKALRPRPPPVEAKNWTCADIAEDATDLEGQPLDSITEISGLRLEAVKACHSSKIVASTSTEYPRLMN